MAKLSPSEIQEYAECAGQEISAGYSMRKPGANVRSGVDSGPTPNQTANVSKGRKARVLWLPREGPESAL